MSAKKSDLWGMLEPFGASQAFRRHSVIYTANQPAQTLYLLEVGQVGLQLHAADGRNLTLRVVEPGQIFGQVAMGEAAHYDTLATALRPVRLLAVQRVAIRRLLTEEPALGPALVEELGRHYLMVSRRLDEVAFKSVPARLASLLLDMADSAAHSEPLRLPRRTHQQLADMINAYRETVTKVLNQFQAARLLDFDRSGITLLNMSRLRELAQSS